MEMTTQEIILKGTPISSGIAIGKPFFFNVVEDVVPEYTVKEKDLDAEVSRYFEALEHGKDDVRRLHGQLEAEGAIEGAAILDAHLQIMQDTLLTARVEKLIRQKQKNAESVFCDILKQCEKRFLNVSDLVFRERIHDLHDVRRRILGILHKSFKASISEIPRNSIICAATLVPSDTAEVKRSHVGAFVTQAGGVTSHSAIVAKAKGIPYVAGVDLEAIANIQNANVIVDGRTGEIILNPSSETLNRYRVTKKRLQSHYRTLEKLGNLEAETFDGFKISLSANVETINELNMVHQYGSSGVGLFRSEYIVLSKDHFPSETEQFNVYCQVVKKMEGLPVVIRTFDIGGDKFTANNQFASESNSTLGCRAIRFLLKEQDVFKTQLRAILRASAYGPVSIMFPMISNLTELLNAKKLLKQMEKQLKKEGHDIGEKIRVGCMVEVPSAALISDALAQECDFLSIGTNDLVQYSLAVDRAEPLSGPNFSPMHPGIIRLIKLTVAQATQYNIPVTVCGEVAADPRFTPLLLGLGVHELSVALRYLPVVKNVVRNVSIVEATQLADKALTLSSATEVETLLEEQYRSQFPEELWSEY